MQEMVWTSQTPKYKLDKIYLQLNDFTGCYIIWSKEIKFQPYAIRMGEDEEIPLFIRKRNHLYRSINIVRTILHHHFTGEVKKFDSLKDGFTLSNFKKIKKCYHIN